MRASKMLGVVVAMSVGFLTTFASADGDNFSVVTAGNKLTLTTNAGWHINKGFPWLLKCGADVQDKSKFELGENSASISGGSGDCQLKGAVCSAATCLPFSKSVKF